MGYLIRSLHERSGQRVAVLVDEYDKPILDALDMPETARANRDYLRGLYGVIKASDAHVRFTFVTGVSKFTKVSLFSDLNNLTDITLDRRYSGVCGYTDDDLDTVFAPELAGLDRDRVREWYNGYRWRGAEKVYNPYDVLLLFDSREFKAHWFETGTPAFLLDTLFDRRVSSIALDEMVGTEDLLSAFEVGTIGTEALLFQTGYLTITGEEELGGQALYRLGYPNREVRQSLNRMLLRRLVQDSERQTRTASACSGCSRPNDCAGLKELSLAFYASFRTIWYTNNAIAAVRGVLRERVLLLFCSAGVRDRGGRVEQPRAAGHGGAHRRSRVPVRVQGGGDGAARVGTRAAPAPGLCGQVPAPERTDPPDRGGVQPRYAQRDSLRGG